MATCRAGGSERSRQYFKKGALEHLPEGVEKAMLRSDTAAYQHDLLRYCASGVNKRFGVIEFAVGSDVTQEFRREVAKLDEREWKPLYEDIDGAWVATKREWAEVPFVCAQRNVQEQERSGLPLSGDPRGLEAATAAGIAR